MSWSRRSWSKDSTASLGRRGAVLLLLAGGALLLSGCGFQPLYGRSSEAARSPMEEMAAIRIAPLPDRIGQQMHNLLRDRLNPRGQPAQAAYLLNVTLNESRRELGVRKDETATRANLILRASFVLRSVGSKEVLVRGTSSSINSYNILTNQFTTIVSESDARKRALRELSDDIRVRLGVYFSSS